MRGYEAHKLFFESTFKKELFLQNQITRKEPPRI